MMKKGIILGITAVGLLLMLFVGMQGLTAAEPINVEAMAAANNLYAAGHYAEAAQLYEQMAAQGAEDAALFYNLGNATYQLGDKVQAGVYYAHAAELAPRDADIQANLAFVGGAAAARSPLQDVMGWMTLNETAVLALSLWFVFGLALFAIVLLDAGRGRKLAAIVAVFSFIVLLLAGTMLGTHVVLVPSGLSGVVAM